MPNGSYSLLVSQDYFKCVVNKHEKVTKNAPIRTYVNKVESRIYLE